MQRIDDHMSGMIAAADAMVRRAPASERYRRLRYYLERARDQLRLSDVHERRVLMRRADGLTVGN